MINIAPKRQKKNVFTRWYEKKKILSTTMFLILIWMSYNEEVDHFNRIVNGTVDLKRLEKKNKIKH